MAGPLGCAETYEVAFHDRTGSVPFGGALEPSALEWGRILDDTSEAKVTIPVADVECCDTLAAVRTWCNDLSIYRDGSELVWQGPVVHLDHGPGETVVTARDVSAWLSRREIPTLIDRTTATGTGPADLTAIAEEVIRAALAPDDPNILPYLYVLPSGVTGERRYEPNTSYAGDELRELGRTGIDWTALGRRIILAGEMPFARLPALTDEDFLGDVRVIEDGLAAATRAIVIGEGITATAGGPGPCGLLTVIVKEDSIKDQASAQAEADALVASRNPAPLIVDVPDGAQLDPQAPVAIRDLVPGVVVPVTATQRCRQVATDLRLTRLAVTYTSNAGEAVKVTLAPAGLETTTV
ncbi:hypothetical protein [Thermomonospora cellulosilytica]|uniref:Integrase-type domain-containing protein n=1 Tax=Thermomonospora cellulosilytica TaxID=1411118 RepID=A0A7W3RAJ7_9ACTN|nr:hypothetical protein [Thermomonospora cellulosilytica]MBA9005911.1 hypothetical protein [Thermomonospora cellulosilytica]